MKHLGDITKLNGYDVEPVDVITGGSPCQDLSVAGKRAGLAGERSGLFMEQIRNQGGVRTGLLREESRERAADSMGKERDAGREPRPDAVCVFDARGNGGGGIAPTITGDHQNRITDYTAIVVYEED